MHIDFLALPLASLPVFFGSLPVFVGSLPVFVGSLPLIVGFVRGKHRFVPSIFEDDIDKDFTGIRCPSCKWRPTREDTWACSPGCGEVWNTFATRGECPGCQRRWPSTQCTRCGVWSDHDAWYEERPQPRR